MTWLSRVVGGATIAYMVGILCLSDWAGRATWVALVALWLVGRIVLKWRREPYRRGP